MTKKELKAVLTAYSLALYCISILDEKYGKDGCGDEDILEVHEELSEIRETLYEII